MSNRVLIGSQQESLPDGEFGALSPFVAELEWLKVAIEMHRLTDPECPRAKALELSRNRLRERLWEAVKIETELPPERVAALLDVHSDTVRYWCRKAYVRYRKTRSGRYLIDMASALEYARSN